MSISSILVAFGRNTNFWILLLYLKGFSGCKRVVGSRGFEVSRLLPGLVLVLDRNRGVDRDDLSVQFLLHSCSYVS